jgi:hypothetical protein
LIFYRREQRERRKREERVFWVLSGGGVGAGEDEAVDAVGEFEFVEVYEESEGDVEEFHVA